MIEIDNLSKSYDNDVVLNIPKMSIPKSETFGLVGNNGAGKTTLFSLILDLIKASTGKVTISNNDVSKNESWKSITSAFIDDQFLISYLTPEEYFTFIGELRNIKKDEILKSLEPYEDFFHGEIMGKKKYIRDLSKGNQKKVGVVGALICDTPLVVLDEPFANLDPTTQIRLKVLLKDKSKNSEKTFVISSHDLQHVTEVCERIVVLDKGHVVKDVKTSKNTLKDLEGFFANQ